MGKRLVVRAVVEGETLFDRREIEATGRYGQTLRMSHYIDVLRKDDRYRLNIETVMEGHEVAGMGPGRHARYILRDNVRLLEEDREAA